MSIPTDYKDRGQVARMYNVILTPLTDKSQPHRVMAFYRISIRDVFRITKLDKAFSLCDSLADAISTVR